MTNLRKKIIYSEHCGIYKAICRENSAFELTSDGRLIYHKELDTNFAKPGILL
jgi:hypothetical protein